ncbi:MAG: phosphatase PAP2 family protein [Fulvivirga sp.]
MFQTDYIHLLQSFDHPVIHAFMVLISAIGITPFVITVLMGITFAVDFKRGMVLINIVAWTAFFTVFAKETINYPRPVHTDPSLKFSQYEQAKKDFSTLLPLKFFEPLSDELLKETKTEKFDHLGFPSGHTSAQVALWIGLVFLFRKRWMLFLGIAMIVLTMISRMYLGSHFLGDVLAGAFIGLFVAFSLIFLVRKTNYLEAETHDLKSMTLLWLPFFLLFFAPITPHWLSGIIIGVNLAAMLTILKRNFPFFQKFTWKRISAAVISLTLFILAFYINNSFTFARNDYADILIIAAINFLAIRGGLSLNRRLHLIRFKY